MNTLKYKGFVATVGYSEKDNVFFGQIEGIESLVNFESDNVAGLQQAFKDAVEDYLIFCQEEGIDPHKSYTGVLNVRLTPEIHSKVAILAKMKGITINAFIRKAVESSIAAASLF